MAIHPDLKLTQELVYNSDKFNFSSLLKEPESSEYGAYTFQLNHFFIKFRVAKITPKKMGQFVTLWKRIGKSPIQCYDFSDLIDFFVISVRKDDLFGQFVFPKSVLCEHKIVSKNGEKGKLAIRVYPPWDKPLSPQAKKTQKWQLECFLPINEDKSKNNLLAQKLYS